MKGRTGYVESERIFSLSKSCKSLNPDHPDSDKNIFIKNTKKG